MKLIIKNIIMKKTMILTIMLILLTCSLTYAPLTVNNKLDDTKFKACTGVGVEKRFVTDLYLNFITELKADNYITPGGITESELNYYGDNNICPGKITQTLSNQNSQFKEFKDALGMHVTSCECNTFEEQTTTNIGTMVFTDEVTNCNVMSGVACSYYNPSKVKYYSATACGEGGTTAPDEMFNIQAFHSVTGTKICVNKNGQTTIACEGTVGSNQISTEQNLYDLLDGGTWTVAEFNDDELGEHNLKITLNSLCDGFVNYPAPDCDFDSEVEFFKKELSEVVLFEGKINVVDFKANIEITEVEPDRVSLPQEVTLKISNTAPGGNHLGLPIQITGIRVEPDVCYEFELTSSLPQIEVDQWKEVTGKLSEKNNAPIYCSSQKIKFIAEYEATEVDCSNTKPTGEAEAEIERGDKPDYICYVPAYTEWPVSITEKYLDIETINHGSADAKVNSKTYYEVRDTSGTIVTQGVWDINPLKVGQTQISTYSSILCQDNPGTYTINVRVDGDDVIDEESEDNNICTGIITCAQIDLKPEQTEIINCDVGVPFRINFHTVMTGSQCTESPSITTANITKETGQGTLVARVDWSIPWLPKGDGDEFAYNILPAAFNSDYDAEGSTGTYCGDNIKIINNYIWVKVSDASLHTLTIETDSEHSMGADGWVKEDDETNNVLKTTFACGAVDLLPSCTNTTGELGEDVTITVGIENRGSTEVGTTHNKLYNLGTIPDWIVASLLPYEIKQKTYTIECETQGITSYSFEVNIEPPPYDPKKPSISWERVVESNYNNNIAECYIECSIEKVLECIDFI